MASARPSRRFVSPTRITTAAAVVALTLTGCSVTNPIATQQVYQASDGMHADLAESVQAQNLIVLTAAEGEVGTMIGAIANHGREEVEVTLQPDGAAAVTVDVPASRTVLLGGDGDGEQIEIDSVGAAPGAHLPVTLSTSQGGTIEVLVPVLDGTLPEYADVVPSPEA